MSYEERFKQALINYHNKLFEDGKLKSEYRENLNYCPVCNYPKSKVYCIKDEFVHKRCLKCGAVYLDPRLNQRATIEFYNSEVNEIYNEQKFHDDEHGVEDDTNNTRNLELLLQNVPDPKGLRLLEIGPGRGTFLRKAKQAGFCVHAVELNNLLIANLKTFTDHVYEKDLLELNLPADHFDVIYSRDVVEHIPNIREFFSELYRIVKPGGIVFFDTPNIDSVVNRATKEYHTIIFAFEHPIQWSAKTLNLAGKIAGFRPHKVYYTHEYQSLAQIADYYLNPSFTYIFPPNKKHRAMKLIQRLTKLKLFWWIDDRAMKLLSKVTGMGATMKVIIKKP